jgi:hypothetical protein
MPSSLPFPGFSWPFTQHAVGLEPDTLYNILACAACFEGVISPGRQITQLMIDNDLLTANVRDGQADAWRDYQQILAEVGLIYSTNIQPSLTITSLGKQFLAGEIGFSELMTHQVLRYQYPNGQKSTIQSRVRSALSEAQMTCPETLLEIQVQSGVHIRPGVLVLRVLLEQFLTDGPATLTVDEALHCLMPIKKNHEWPVALGNLQAYRRGGFTLAGVVPANRRNVQDWFKFLSKSDLFELSGSSLTLSQFARTHQDVMGGLLTEQEDVSKTWIPNSFDMDSRKNWFKYFGSLDASASIERSIEEVTEKFIHENYVGGVADEDQVSPTSDAGINLQEHSFQEPSQGEDPGLDIDLAAAIGNLRAGILKRKIKTRLHDQLVSDLADVCREKGGTVFEDPNSVDLLVIWPNKKESIFEVKTVTGKSLQQRLRLALGQVQEYAYRRIKQTGLEPDKSVAIDMALPESAWQLDFLNGYANTGLVCKRSDDFNFHFPEASNATVYLS